MQTCSRSEKGRRSISSFLPTSASVFTLPLRPLHNVWSHCSFTLLLPAATACCYCLHSVLACCSSSLVLPATACPVCGAAVLHTSAACCYCLLLPTALQCVEPLFLEPSTGRKYPLTASPYEGIEYLWNHQNFWVCMQMALPHSDSRAHPKDVSYDLLDPSKWESVFEGKGAQVRLALSRE